ncbi:MAG: hypothetical protein HY670_07695 [Chloroflexi bacterium]|nr:hypothetical protein [Chloroflexota bacterium]
MDEDEFREASEDYEAPPTPDHFFVDAQKEIKGLYQKDRESVYYIRQLQVMLEKRYFHWVTNNAIIGLYKTGYLKDYRVDREKGTSTRYFIHRSNRYPVRQVKKLEEVVEEYSQDHITRSCGHRAEDLFCKALALRGFMPVASKVRDYNGKKWVKTGHDLDFVFKRDGVDYGCEIKNTLGYIEKEEMQVKLKMCSFFGVRPLFIMRYSPKTYNKMIYDHGGFALIFETQIYEISQGELVRKIKKVLGLPVVCSSAIPDGIIDRFEKWHVVNCL